MPFLVEDLIESIKTRSFVPVSQDTFTEEGILSIASEEMLLGIVSDIMSIREDFFLRSSVSPVYANLSTYAVPPYAIGNALKTLFLRDAGGSRKKLTRVDVDQSAAFNGSAGEPSCYYFVGDEIELLPKPSADGLLEFVYFETTNALALTETCAKITGVSTLSDDTIFDVSSDLTASLNVGDTVDFLSNVSPFLLWARRIPIVSISSNQIQVATSAVVNAIGTVEPQIGNYICPSGTANIPMLPAEFHPVLAQATAVRILMGLGDVNKLTVATQILDRLRSQALKLVKNRVESSPERIGPRNNILRAFRRR